MSEQRVAHRYAKSLLDLSQQKNVLSSVHNDIKQLADALNTIPTLSSMVKNPIVDGEKKLAILKEVYGKQFNALTLDFFGIVVHKKREYFLADICSSFIKLYNELNKITTATVTTAIEISAEAKAEVSAFIAKQTGKQVVLNTKVDASLIGGIVILMEDKLYDASVSGKLRKAKQELLNTYISK